MNATPDTPTLTFLQRTKNRVLPMGSRVRRLPFGIGRGLNLRLDFRHQSRLFLGLYELELNSHLRRLCRPGYDSFDVGGQIGYDALVLAKLTGGRVLSFEMDPDMCASMEESFAANPAHAGRLAARRAFVTDRSEAGGDRLALDDAAYGEGGFVPDVIKMDIEGGELDALRGARRILSERRPNLIVEVHSVELERECAELLRDAGYAPEVVDARGWLPDDRPLPHNRWLVAEGRVDG